MKADTIKKTIEGVAAKLPSKVAPKPIKPMVGAAVAGLMVGAGLAGLASWRGKEIAQKAATTLGSVLVSKGEQMASPK